MKIKCPHCNQSIEADDSYAGKKVDCPACSKTFRAIPAIEDALHHSPAPSKEQGDPPVSSHEKYRNGERIIHLVLAVIAIMFGIGVLNGSESAIHEILAGILFLIAAVLFSGCAVAKSIHLLREDLERRSSDSK